jgi:hypothetical protein
MGFLERGGTVERSRRFSFLLVASLLSAAPVSAKNGAVCDDLRGQLANVSETVSTRHDARRYTSAIVDQNLQLRQMENQFGARGCSTSGAAIVNAEDAAACDQMQSALDRMQENLRFLTARQDEIRNTGGSDDVLRDQLQAALSENGCDEPLSADTETIGNHEEPPATPQQQAMRRDTFYPPTDNGEIAPPIYGGSGVPNLQTVCVRTCDGGFFPMTANATPLNFQHDAETCARMCPGVPTELYFRYLPDQESAEMVSASTGAPYSEMPFAFAYRKRQPGEKSSCTCNLSAYYEEMRREKGLGKPVVREPQGSITSIQTLKQAPSAAINAEPAKTPEERPYDPSTSKVRQVGPQFLATDQGKIDLKHPAAPGPQPRQ